MSSGGGPDAFTFVIVSYDLSERIESICPWKDRVYVGLADGSLIVLEPEFEIHEDGPWSVEKHVKGIGKRIISQLEPADSLSGLFVLSQAGLQMYSLPQLELLTQVPCAGIPIRFAWNDAKRMLCVAVRKSLVFYTLEGMDFVETNAVTIPDAVRLMAWCDGNLCYCSKTRYVFVDPATGQLMESIVVGRGYPGMTPLSHGEILLLKDNQAMYVRSDGSLARNVSIAWRQSPLAVVLCEPFVVGLMDNFMEVRNVNPTARQCVIQMFNDVDRINITSTFLGADGSIFMASRDRRTVCRLNPTPLRQQIDTLIAMKEFQDALLVVDLLDGASKTQTEDDIRVSYGIHLFMQKEYDDGLMQFAMRSQRSTLLLLKLFPSLLPAEMMDSFTLPVSEKYYAEYVEPQGGDYARAVSSLLPLLQGDRTRLASRKRDDKEEDKKAATAVLDIVLEDAETQDDNTPQDLAATPTRSKHSRMESRAKRTRLEAVVDTAIMKAMLVCPDSGDLLRFVRNENFIDLVEGERSLKPAGRYLELSGLYQSHGMHDLGLEILRLVSLEPEKLEYPPRGAASDLRMDTGVWAAVTYLSKLTEKDNGVIQKHAGWVLEADPEAALEVFVGAERRLPPYVVLPILDKHAPHFSSVYLEAMLDKGDASREDFETTLVNIYLKQAIKDEAQLGHLHKLGTKSKKFDFAMVNEKSTRRLLQKDAVFEGSGELILDDVAKTKEKPEFLMTFDPPSPLESYNRLRELLIDSPFIDPMVVLDSIPRDSLLELQALLLERQRNYRSALAVYIQRLQDITLAEMLCDRVYEKEKTSTKTPEATQAIDFSEQTENVYMDMIRIYLEPEGVTGSRIRTLTDDEWRDLCVLLCRKRYRINIEEMFDLLPGDVELGVLMQFIEGALRTLAEQQRNLLIVHSLYTSENLFRKEQLIRCNQRMVPVTYESACCICHKRIGNAVFVAYPNDSLAHIACYTRQNKTDSTTVTSRVSSGYSAGNWI